MSWLYSQALVEEYSVDTCSGGERSVQLSVICTQHQFSHRDKMTDISRLSQYGLTYAALTVDLGEVVLTSFLAGFPVKTSQPLVEEQASEELVQVSGARWSELFARWDLDSCSWRTPQCSLVEGLELFSETWPRSGSMRSGSCWARPMSELHTKEIGSGFWPTPTKTDISLRKKKYSQGGTALSLAVQRWPTPTKHNSKECAAPSEYKRKTPTLAAQAGGKLNPIWIEWLMGWPMGWTDLEPLEMGKFQEWQRLHLQF